MDPFQIWTIVQDNYFASRERRGPQCDYQPPFDLSLICEAEPLHQDLRRFNKKGLFGIILKHPTAQA